MTNMQGWSTSSGHCRAGRRRYTVLGTGLMGAAIAKRLALSGATVSAWNRSYGRSKPLVADGVVVFEHLNDCLQEPGTLILSVLDYDSASSLLQDHVAQLQGRDVINLITGTPAEAHEFAAFLSACGVGYLDGAIEAYPSDIGQPDAAIMFAGDRRVWDTHRDALLAIGGASQFVGGGPGAANVLDAALAGTFLNSSLGAACEAIAFLSAAGIDLRDPAVDFDYWIDLLRSEIHELVRALEADDFVTTTATLAVYAAAVRQWRAAAIAAGVRASMLSANLNNLERAESAGLGAQALAAQVRTMFTELGE